jgi:hypothetical protein
MRPKERLLYAAQPNKIHPLIHKGYNSSKGGCGTVNAIIRLHDILSNQAINSPMKRMRLVL